MNLELGELHYKHTLFGAYMQKGGFTENKGGKSPFFEYLPA